MTTTQIKNTHIKELLEVSAGNLEVLKRMTEEFCKKVQERPKRTEQIKPESPIRFELAGESHTVSVLAEPYRRGYRIVITIE